MNRLSLQEKIGVVFMGLTAAAIVMGAVIEILEAVS